TAAGGGRGSGAGPGRGREPGRAGDPVPGRGARTAAPLPQRTTRPPGADRRCDGCPPAGHAPGLALAFLEAAAPGYLTDTDWGLLTGDWLEQGLGYTAKPSKVVRGPLTPIRARPAPSVPDRPADRPARQLARP